MDLASIGFTVAELDQSLLADDEANPKPGDDILLFKDSAPVTQPGAIWILGRHGSACGTAETPTFWTG